MLSFLDAPQLSTPEAYAKFDAGAFEGDGQRQIRRHGVLPDLPFPGAGSCPVTVSDCYAALASRSSAIASETMTALSAPRTSI